jgi:predicted nucleotidyltransferase
MSDQNSLQYNVSLLENLLRSDPRIRAAWLEGSLGRGNADRYSDIDLHVLLAESDLAAFQAGAEEWLNAVRPIVLCTLLFGGRMVNALTEEGVRIDLWLHTEERVSLRPGKAIVLHDPAGLIHFDGKPSPPDDAVIAAELEAQIKEFWRCIALLPTVIGREERIVAFQGLNVELNLLINILFKGYRIERDAGIKKLNAFLPEEARTEIEQALSTVHISDGGLAPAHISLARLTAKYGRIAAGNYGFEYPDRLEAAVVKYVYAELEMLSKSAP